MKGPATANSNSAPPSDTLDAASVALRRLAGLLARYEAKLYQTANGHPVVHPPCDAQAEPSAENSSPNKLANQPTNGELSLEPVSAPTVKSRKE